MIIYEALFDWGRAGLHYGRSPILLLLACQHFHFRSPLEQTVHGKHTWQCTQFTTGRWLWQYQYHIDWQTYCLQRESLLHQKHFHRLPIHLLLHCPRKLHRHCSVWLACLDLRENSWIVWKDGARKHPKGLYGSGYIQAQAKCVHINFWLMYNSHIIMTTGCSGSTWHMYNSEMHE